MAISDSLTIKKITKENGLYHFECAGSIDVKAKPALAILIGVPAKAKVVLNFKKIERVNSMGLSLLLQIFEDWEAKQITIEVKNLNRMVNMLFKITGLGRFVGVSEVAKKGAKETKIQAPIHVHTKKNTLERKRAVSPGAKLNFIASLQTGQQLTGWYLFNTYLQRRMQRAIHFDQSHVLEDQLKADLLFSKPFESYLMIKEHGFMPLMRPISEADEVIILARADDERTLKEFQAETVVTASENSFVYLLGRFLCDEEGLDSSQLKFAYSGNEIKSLQMLIRKKANLLFMLKKTYDGLSSFGKKNVRKLDESATDFAFHLLSVSPRLAAEKENLNTILKEMTENEAGQGILKDIECKGWCPVEDGEFNMLKMVFERYVTV
ncbi:MAG: PhnD/SsuA/transferrin family substrate-binding protein [Methylococcales bacterium]|nr:PhnD/SsuA/transferrin family substrate-binding protein [Methylococcales bacterium]MCK5925368.1 PhnD/SsuA/transferrin family substrate-binding protein [Methylococcales bacterium]